MKFYIKDVINDIYVEGLTPYNKKHWEKFMEAFFVELKNTMDDHNTTDVTLLRFGSFKTKPLTSLKQFKNYVEQYRDGILSIEELHKYALKVKNIVTEYEYKTEHKVNEFLEQEIPQLNEWLGKADWWPNIRDAIRKSPRKARPKRGSTAVNVDWNGSSVNRE